MNSYDMITTIIATILFTVVALAIYKYLLNPQAILKVKAQKCPDMWSYDGKMCVPNYSTGCTPFDPSAPSIQSAAAKCNTAHMCGTSWTGICP